MNSLIWSVVVAVIATAWFRNTDIGLIIAAALMINLVCAALAGFSIALALKHLGIDPALAGSVILTTVTDVVGFMAFLGLGTWYLLLPGQQLSEQEDDRHQHYNTEHPLHGLR